MINERRLRVLDANILYLICALLFVFIGSYVQQKSLKYGLLITEYFLVLTPPILYLASKKINIKQSLRLNKLSFKHSMKIVGITLLMYPTAVFANALMMLLLSLLGNLNIPQLPTANNATEYIVLMLIISLSAGLCEEVFFRGFMMRGYEALGSNKAIIISSILFGVFHFNIYNLLGPIVLGLVFGYLVMITDSLYAGILGHIVNNGFAVSLGFFINLISTKLNISNTSASEVPTTLALLGSLVFFGILAIIAGFLAYHLFKGIKKDMEKQKYNEELEVLDPATDVDIEEYDTQSITTAKEYIPLLFIVPIFIFVAFVQIREIIGLG